MSFSIGNLLKIGGKSARIASAPAASVSIARAGPARPALAKLAFPKLSLPLALSLVFLLAGASLASEVYRGRVERVIDGDTISLLTHDYERLRVRLYGIDTPEKGQIWGKEATAALSSQIAGRVVEVVVEDVDRYSRQVGIIFMGDLNVNLWMVSRGHAWVYERYCVLRDVCRDMSLAQDKARAEGLGLWGLPEAVAPWDYRRGKRR